MQQAEELSVVRAEVPGAARRFCELTKTMEDLTVESVREALLAAVAEVFAGVDASLITDSVKRKVAMYILYAVALDKIFEVFEASLSEEDTGGGKILFKFFAAINSFSVEESVLHELLNEHFSAYSYHTEKHTWHSQVKGGFEFAYFRLVNLEAWLQLRLGLKYNQKRQLEYFAANRRGIVAQALRQAARILYTFAGNISIANAEAFSFNKELFDSIFEIEIDETSGLAKVKMDKEKCADRMKPQESAIGCPALYIGLVKKLINTYCTMILKGTKKQEGPGLLRRMEGCSS